MRCPPCLKPLVQLRSIGTGVVEVLGGVGGVVALEAVLIVPLSLLLWDKPSYLVVVFPPKDLVNGFLGDDTVDGSLL